jgi:iron complex outermembrane receptor protein
MRTMTQVALGWLLLAATATSVRADDPPAAPSPPPPAPVPQDPPLATAPSPQDPPPATAPSPSPSPSPPPPATSPSPPPPATAPSPPPPPPTTTPRPASTATTPRPASTTTPAAADNGKTEIISITTAAPERILFTGRAPVSVITRDDLDASGHATLGDILQSLPSQANAANAQSNIDGDGTTHVNLRGLGAERTLVLINGRRMVAGGPGADSLVDLNAIPLAMIERVEIMKDGASTLYGADAVGGVVNVVTRPQYDGADVAVLASTSQHGDGTEYDASLVTGFTSKDKDTYVVLAADFQHHEPVFAADRRFSDAERGFDYATGRENRTLSLTTPNGRIDTAGIGAGGLQPPGCTSTVCKPTANGGFANFGTGDLYNDAASNYIYTPSTRSSVYATGGNRVNDHAAIFGEFLFQHRKSSRELSPVPFDANEIVSKDSMYNPLGADLSDVRRRLGELGPRQFLDTATTYRAVIGLRGTLPVATGPLEDWTYELSYDFGSTTQTLGTTGQLFLPRVADALGPSMNFKGTPICVKTPGDPTTQVIYKIPLDTGGFQIIPCVPTNILAPAGKIPLAQLKNLTFNDLGHGDDGQATMLATTGGRIATLPHHGEITLTAGADYRNENGQDQPPAEAIDSGKTTAPLTISTKGEFHVYEGYAEAAIVPFVGGEIARRLEFNLGARVVDHQQFGTDLMYKAGGLFRTVQGLSARATYATAFRTPSLLELLEGPTQREPFVGDPCDSRPPSVGTGTKTLDANVQAQCAARGVPAGTVLDTNQVTSLIGGNDKLTPETAATATFGVVYEPPQLPGLAASADYWHIKIDNAIETLGVATILANCYDRGLQPFCAQIMRDVNHRIQQVSQAPQNVSRTMTAGVDFAMMYDAKLPGFGRLHSALEAQYLIAHDLTSGAQTIHGAGFYDLGAFPHVRANLTSEWRHPGGATGGLAVRYVGTYKECVDDDCNSAHNLATASRDVGRYVKVDLFAGYDLRSRAGKTSLQLGINNVFNITPPIVYNAPSANSDAATYDFVGRMAFVRLSQQF